VVAGDGAAARGNHLDNLIAGGAGRQTFFGGGGHDVLEGGADTDIFVVSGGDHGNVVVNDFQCGVDRIRLDGTAFTDFAQNSMTQAGSDVVVDLGDGQTLTLRGHQTTDFSAADFWTAIDLSHFQLAFADEFNSFDWSPDGSHGWRTTLDWGNRTLPANHEAQYYSDSSVGVDPFHLHDGVLDITATAGSNPLGLPYNSGVITTQGSFSQLYGYFEMRAELPSGAGLWPTFWLLPANHSWPPELDVFEVLGSDPKTAVATVHSAATGAHTAIASAVATGDLSESFHTFGVNWRRTLSSGTSTGQRLRKPPRRPTCISQCTSLRIWLSVAPAVGQALPTRPHFQRQCQSTTSTSISLFDVDVPRELLTRLAPRLQFLTHRFVNALPPNRSYGLVCAADLSRR
jgi:Glycosyl hydrolases family 16